jgi:hypothetical protein
MTAVSVCQSEFDRGRAARVNHPLHQGHYKLREELNRLDRRSATLAAIADYRSNGATGHVRVLGCCTSDDAAVWLKRQPAEIAFDLGYYTLPAIAALVGDGVEPELVRKALASSAIEAGALVADCERVRVVLRGGIAPEYERLKLGCSLSLPLVQRAASIIQAGIALAPSPPGKFSPSTARLHEVSEK